MTRTSSSGTGPATRPLSIMTASTAGERDCKIDGKPNIAPSTTLRSKPAGGRVTNAVGTIFRKVFVGLSHVGQEPCY